MELKGDIVPLLDLRDMIALVTTAALMIYLLKVSFLAEPYIISRRLRRFTQTFASRYRPRLPSG